MHKGFDSSSLDYFMNNRAPLIFAIVLLLLPVLYVGSYLALVVPGDPWIRESYGNQTPPVLYRLGGDRAEWFYCPLEQIDRKVRPCAWDNPLLWPDSD